MKEEREIILKAWGRERPHLARLKKAIMGGNKYMGMKNKFQLEYGELLGKDNIRAPQ